MLQQRGTSFRLLIIALFLFAVPLLMADQNMVSMITEVVESFDGPTYSWQAFPSKFGIDPNGNSMWNARYIAAWPERLFGRNRDKAELKVLGVHGGFVRQGYNFVEIIPGKGEGKDFQPEPIRLPGRVSNLNLWVWGSNYNFYMEAHLRDHTGIEHVLPLGSMQFSGWNTLSAHIPASIPQTGQHIPVFKGLQLTKLVIWTRPEEQVDDFYVYLDQLQVITDKFESRFDGDDLSDADRVQEIWASQKR